MRLEDEAIVVEGLGKRFRPRSPEDASLLGALQGLARGGPGRGEVWALKDVSFRVARGETVGLLGRNGAGKSVLLSLIAGLLRPTQGRARVNGRAQPFFQMGSGLHGRLSVEANMRLCAALLGLEGRAEEEHLEAALEFSGLRSRRGECAGELSAGLAARIPFSVALQADLDVLLVDEMFLVGDAVFREKCLGAMERLREAGKTFLIAAHDVALLTRFCRRCLVLEEGRLVADGPAPSTARRYLDGLGAAGAPGSMGAADEDALAAHAQARRLLPAALAAAGARIDAVEPASDADLLRVHTRDWLARLKANDLTEEEEQAWSLPFSRDILPSAWRECGGTLAACRRALSDGVGVYLGGGLHHAVAAHGRGYCAANDIVVALRALAAQGRARRPLIVDLDAHQGDGTALLLADEPAALAFSLHNRAAYPPRKTAAGVNVELEPGAGDEAYLALLERRLAGVLDEHGPDFLVYVAGADPYADDPLGGLGLTREGLARRDQMVFAAASARGLPIAVVAGGGYAPAQELVAIRLATVAAAFAAFPRAERRVAL